MSDDAKKTILARRAKFIAAAVASVGIACSKTQSSPEPCLSVPMERDSGPVPMPCLSPMPADASPVDAGVDANVTAEGDASADAGDAGKKPRLPAVGPTATPVPCLSVKAPPPTKRQQ